MKRKNIFRVAIIVICILIGYFFIAKNKQSRLASENLTKMATPIAKTEVNKSFSFPIDGDLKKEEDKNLKFSIIEAQKVGVVATQGSPMMAKTGQSYLVIAIEMENNSSNPVQINTQNYIRLIGEEGKKYAPDFYNGLVEVPPISTKRDELGFVIAKDQKEFKILVGPVDGEKEEITLTL